MTDIDRKLVEILDFWVNDVEEEASMIKIKELHDAVLSVRTNFPEYKSYILAWSLAATYVFYGNHKQIKNITKEALKMMKGVHVENDSFLELMYVALKCYCKIITRTGYNATQNKEIRDILRKHVNAGWEKLNENHDISHKWFCDVIPKCLLNSLDNESLEYLPQSFKDKLPMMFTDSHFFEV